MPADGDLRVQTARRVVANLRGEPPPRRRPRMAELVWPVALLVLVATLLGSLGLDIYRAVNTPAPRPLYVCVQVEKDGGVTKQTGPEPCWQPVATPGTTAHA